MRFAVDGGTLGETGPGRAYHKLLGDAQMAKGYLTSREVALILGVSESSVKRWIDDGLMPATRTAGGHRRIATPDIVDYIRRNNLPVLNADILGFAETQTLQPQLLEDQELTQRLYFALENGDAVAAAAMIHGPFLGGRSLVWLFDGPVRTAMHRLGELWQQRPDGIMIEHRATEICVQAVMRLRQMLIPRENIPAALGAATAGDPYILPTLMAATVLRDLGMRDINLGPDTPLPSLLQAARTEKPALVWLSFSGLDSGKLPPADLTALADELQTMGAALIIGGRELGPLQDFRHPNITIGQSMADLVSLAQSVLAKTGR